MRGGSTVLGGLFVFAAAAAIAAEPLFPTPLHLVRRIETPASATPILVDEYCAGNRIVSVSGDRVTIVDYSAERVTEIDRKQGTYSVTAFAAIAKVEAAVAGAQASGDGPEPDVSVEVDASVPLSRDAVEALIGAAYPNSRTPVHEALLRGGRRSRVATNAAAAADTFALPREQTIRVDGAVLRNSVIRVTHDVAPDDVMTIPPGSRLVESRAARHARELRELDELPARP